MKASNIVVANLTTYRDCAKALDSIEMDEENIAGGRKAMYSGRNTYLKPAAQKKFDAIEGKMDKMGCED